MKLLRWRPGKTRLREGSPHKYPMTSFPARRRAEHGKEIARLRF